MNALARDLRHTVRTLAKAPAFVVAVVLTLGLAIGANTAVFSVVNGVLLKPLPFKDPDRLVRLAGWTMRPQNVKEWHDSTDIFEAVSPLVYARRRSLRSGNTDPEYVGGTRVSTEFFPLLGVQPQLGRWFLPEEDRPGAHPVAIISHGLWVRHFASDPDAIGRTLTFDETSFIVVGVLPAEFDFGRLARGDLWLPLTEWDAISFNAIGRLRRGVTVEQARTKLKFLAAQVEPETALERDMNTRNSARMSVYTLYETMVQSSRAQLWILLGVVGFVLLIGCANVANLLLTRATGRQHELAVRTALGATRGRLIAQLLSETLLLFLAGGVFGTSLAYAGLKPLLALTPDLLPRKHEVAIDGYVLLTTVVITLLAGLLFGLLPALRATRINLTQGLRGGQTRTNIATGHHRARSALVIGQVALTLILLTGAGLFLRTFLILLPSEPGFDPANKLTFRVTLPSEHYTAQEQQREFVTQLLQNLQPLPGVKSVAGINHLQMGGASTASILLPTDRESSAELSRKLIHTHWITPNYFSLMRMGIVRGRGLTEFDRSGSAPVAVINRSLARRYWPAENPLGKKFHLRWFGDTQEINNLTVIGVVEDTRDVGWQLDARPRAFIPFEQWNFPINFISMIVHTGSNPESLVGGVRDAVRSIDPTLPVVGLRTFEEIAHNSVNDQRSRMLLTGLFAALALTLALVGIYGVLAHAVAERMHEFGIRMALGAQRGNILRLVLRQGLVLALTGTGLGLLGSFWLTTLLKNLLYGIAPTDPLTFAAVAALMLLAALLACYVPARRATKIDPMEALRYE